MAKVAFVAGGSLAGLMHAIVLKKTGYEVHVHERSAPEALESQAAGIRIGPEVYDFIQQHVRPSAEYFTTADMVEIMDSQGTIVQKLPPQQPLRLTTWRIVYDMLKDALLAPVEGGEQVATYKTRQLVQDVEEAGEKVKVTILDLNTDTTTCIESDLVIAADGAHSTMRKKLSPDVVPQYAGYITWRGRVPDSAVAPTTLEVLRDRCVILRVEGGYQISYHVPSASDPTSSARDFVWIWYENIPKNSQQLIDTFTDIHGKSHQTTVPRGAMSPDVWARVLARTSSVVVNPYFIDIMEAIEEPFVSAINDFAGRKAVFFGGKVLLVGDAFALCRPHGGGSTSLAAAQAEGLLRALRGEGTLEEWERECVEAAEKAAKFSLVAAGFFWGEGVVKG